LRSRWGFSWSRDELDRRVFRRKGRRPLAGWKTSATSAMTVPQP
jgi:hypothetical protein